MDYKIQIIDHLFKVDDSLFEEVRKLTEPVRLTYPRQRLWLEEKFIPEFKTGKRQIVTATDEENRIVGVALLKNTEDEKKICCLFIHKKHRGRGIGGRLIQKSFEALGTDKPLISVSNNNYPQFEKLIKLHGFKFSYKKNGIYKKENEEFYFNNKATDDLKKEILIPLFSGSFRKQ